MQGAFIALFTVLSYFTGGGGEYGITMAFVTLSICEALQSLNMRSRIHSLFAMKRQNYMLWGAVALSVALTLCAVYVPGINYVFSLEALTGAHLLIALGFAVLIIPVAEIIKLINGKALLSGLNILIESNAMSCYNRMVIYGTGVERHGN